MIRNLKICVYINITNIPNFIESSQDKMHPELENQIVHAIDNYQMEMPSKARVICDEDQNENKMEVTENAQALAHPVTVQEGRQPLEDPGTAASAGEPGPPRAVDPVTVPPETRVCPSEESSSLCPGEQSPVEGAPEETERKENPESSTAFMDFGTTAAAESCVSGGSCRDKSAKPEPESAAPVAADRGKARVSSPPARPTDLPSHELLHSYPSTLSASVDSIMPATYFSVTPKIGMGKPAITKRKFSPGRPRSKQVGQSWRWRCASGPPGARAVWFGGLFSVVR